MNVKLKHIICQFKHNNLILLKDVNNIADKLTHIIHINLIVPIIPEFLYDIRHPNATLDTLPRIPLTTPIPCDRPNDNMETTTLSAGKIVLFIIRDKK